MAEERQESITDVGRDEMIARIREFFLRYEKSGDGYLGMVEVARALKSLSDSFSDDEVTSLCEELDSSKDGRVSCKEFIDWVMRGKLAEQVKVLILHSTGDKRTARIKEVFNGYDKSGDGSLDIDELKRALQGMGSFTASEIKNVCADLDKSNDGEVSFQEFSDWIRSASGSKVIMKAKAILAPSDDDGLEAAFYCWCGFGHADMEGKCFTKMCKELKLVDKNLNDTAIDLLFTKIKQLGQRSIDFPEFLTALEKVAEKKGIPLHTVHQSVLASTARRLPGTTKAEDMTFGKTGPSSGQKRRAAELKALKAAMSGKVAPGEKQPTSEDCIDIYRTFGCHTRAGMSLKRLYNRSSSAPALKKQPASRPTSSEHRSPRLAWQSPYLTRKSADKFTLTQVHLQWEMKLKLQALQMQHAAHDAQQRQEQNVQRETLFLTSA